MRSLGDPHSSHDPCAPAQASRPVQAPLPYRKPRPQLRWPAPLREAACRNPVPPSLARCSFRSLSAARSTLAGEPGSASAVLPPGGVGSDLSAALLRNCRTLGPGLVPWRFQAIARRSAALLGPIARYRLTKRVPGSPFEVLNEEDRLFRRLVPTSLRQFLRGLKRSLDRRSPVHSLPSPCRR
jgi:hypothetical protein